MIFVINWSEVHNLKDWGEDEETSIKNLLNNRLNATITVKHNIGGLTEIELADFFVANSYTELRQHLTTYEIDEYKTANETGVIQFTEKHYKSLETLKIFGGLI